MILSVAFAFMQLLIKLLEIELLFGIALRNSNFVYLGYLNFRFILLICNDWMLENQPRVYRKKYFPQITISSISYVVPSQKGKNALLIH